MLEPIHLRDSLDGEIWSPVIRIEYWHIERRES